MQLAWLTEAPWLDRQRLDRYPKLFLAIFAIAAIVWLTMGDGLLDPKGKPIGTDFVAFFSASALALEGEAAAVFDGETIYAAERAAVDGDATGFFPWFYPPTFLIVVLPLALLPYGWALAAWLGTTLFGYLAVIRRIAPVPEAIWLAIAFPAVLVNIGHGQIDTADRSLTSPPPVRPSAKKTNPSAKTIVPQAMPPAQSTSGIAAKTYIGYSAATATQT